MNDVSWGQVSLCNLINSWLPGVFSFLLGITASRISTRQSLRRNLKSDLLKIFVPTFNLGRTISGEDAVRAYEELQMPFKTYLQVYPKAFKQQGAEELRGILERGIVSAGQINSHVFDSEKMKKAIRKL